MAQKKATETGTKMALLESTTTSVLGAEWYALLNPLNNLYPKSGSNCVGCTTPTAFYGWCIRCTCELHTFLIWGGVAMHLIHICIVKHALAPLAPETPISGRAVTTAAF
ncbi:hypothetical protein EVAR_91945_1 [Eumeta japonica]|uniref:Uncharacterized protein n=1 Tax=Eumeta variegata TaxID=151549 RepID=A0A4C1T9Y3_EUMVA|nr:hypothetical protein EVAR_91945_1 [Eumeta japonica]